MTIPTVADSSYPTPDEVRNQVLADLRYAYAQRGVTVNVEPGSDFYIRANAFANRVSIAFQNGKLAAANMSPLDATGDALVELAGVFGVTKRAASSASGFVTATGTGIVTIPVEFQCTAPSGIQYQTTASVTVDVSGSGAKVSVQAVSAGEDTDTAAGVIMTWDSAAIGALDQTCTVSAGGIDGGADEDDDETLRVRLLERLRFPGVGGNTSYVKQLAEAATAAVERAYVYPSARGPASYDVAVTKEGGDRTLEGANVSIVAGAILAEMPGSADLNCTTVSAQQLDVILDATLPLPVNAGGIGGGWRDAAPWPSTAETGVNVWARVTAAGVAGGLAANQIRVDSTATDPPVAGKHFAIWNPTGGDDGTGEMAEFLIGAVSGAAPNLVIDIDTNQSDPISFIAVGMYCSAGAVNLKDYALAFQAAMWELGPGEKTTNVDIVPRARRRPSTDELAPSDLTTLQLAAVMADFPEMLNLTYAGRFNTGLFTTRTSPSTPTTTADPPRILTLNRLAIRRQA